jgi:hypothetical protein
MSKSVTFLIGNGFDLKVGLETHYTDFYKIYTRENANDSKNIKRFKREILKDETDGWKNWMDFEIGMGQQSSCFNGDHQVEDFIECFSNFVECFNKYLITECKSINWGSVSTVIYGKFIESVTHFYMYVKSVLRSTIRKYIHHSLGEVAKLNFIQFNYTNTFDELIKRSNLSNQLSVLLNSSSDNALNSPNQLGANLHVHGEMNGKHPTIGVNDETQISNETIRKDLRSGSIFIKPKFLDILQNNNVNQNIPRTDALNVIAESDLICTFGVSLGASDKFWWEKIGKWLTNSNGVFIIFDKCGMADNGTSPMDFLNCTMGIMARKQEIISRFSRLAEINPEWLNKNPNKIIVELDSDMFAFKLPKKEIMKSEAC